MYIQECESYFQLYMLQVEVTQEYQNKEKNAIEVIYFFPVEEEAAVTACSAELERRTTLW